MLLNKATVKRASLLLLVLLVILHPYPGTMTLFSYRMLTLKGGEGCLSRVTSGVGEATELILVRLRSFRAVSATTLGFSLFLESVCLYFKERQKHVHLLTLITNLRSCAQ